MKPPTGTDDLLAGDKGWRDLSGELEHGLVGVFVGVWVNVGLEGLQLICGVVVGGMSAPMSPPHPPALTPPSHCSPDFEK